MEMSRRRSIDYGQESPLLTLEDAYDQIDIRVIPAGTRCHLWNAEKKHIDKAHFILLDNLNVLVRVGHGPMFKLIEGIAYGKEKYSGVDLFIDDIRGMPLVGKLVNSESRVNEVCNLLAEQYSDVDAIFMAMTNDGEIGLKYLDKGTKPNKIDLL